MLGTCTSLFMLSKKWIIQILYYSCNKVKYISTVCNMYPTIHHIVIFQQNNEVHLWHIFKSFFAISSLLKVLWIPIFVSMFCKSVDRKLYQIFSRGTSVLVSKTMPRCQKSNVGQLSKVYSIFQSNQPLL